MFVTSLQKLLNLGGGGKKGKKQQQVKDNPRTQQDQVGALRVAGLRQTP
jgi:hypothetical protein